ncbi:MAG TPA: hypothetical protein VHT75_04295 [Acidimicrobiales bacterium]|jgi:hypothetical protein|nr:hypothetical protein [Acidimicrobiales bacterium]
MKYIRKPATVEAAQVSLDLTISGVTIPAGHWLVQHEDGSVTAVNDADFVSEYEAAPEPVAVPDVPVEAPPEVAEAPAQ